MSWSPDLDRQLQEIKALLLDDNDTARLPRIERRVALLSHQLDLIMERETKIMATLDDLSAALDALKGDFETYKAGVDTAVRVALANASAAEVPAIQALADKIAAIDAEIKGT